MGEVEEGKGGINVMEGDLTWGGEHTVHYTDDVVQNCTPETYVILSAKVTPINSIMNNYMELLIFGPMTNSILN